MYRGTPRLPKQRMTPRAVMPPPRINTGTAWRGSTTSGSTIVEDVIPLPVSAVYTDP